LNVNTNGMLLTREVAEDLLDSGVDLIVIGIDGFSRESYERARYLGSRDLVYENVEYLLQARGRRVTGPEIQVQFIEMDYNQHELPQYKSHWLSRGAVVKVRRQLSWGGKFETSLCVPEEERIPCPWAITMMHVFWDGRVPRCPGDMEGEEGFGNAWEESIEDLWAQLGGYRDKHLSRRFDELPDRCLTCQDWMTGAADRIRPDEALLPTSSGLT
jgi:MoaA/NifB/PqqE/SkfB family radical SAM enzyme